MVLYDELTVAPEQKKSVILGGNYPEQLPDGNTAVLCGKRARGDCRAQNLTLRIYSRRKTLVTDTILFKKCFQIY